MRASRAKPKANIRTSAVLADMIPKSMGALSARALHFLQMPLSPDQELAPTNCAPAQPSGEQSLRDIGRPSGQGGGTKRQDSFRRRPASLMSGRQRALPERM